MSGNTFKINCIFLGGRILTLTNSDAPDEMQHYAAFDLGLHCLEKYACLGVTRIQRALYIKALSQYNVLANVCRRMKYISSTLAYAEI